MHEHLKPLLNEEGYPEEIRDALNYAATAHEESIRKLSGNPYIEHPLEVFELVRDAGGSTPEQIAAILHDTIEKGKIDGKKITYEDLEDRFGTDVADIVLGVSKDDSIEDWYECNEAYLVHLSTEAPEGSVTVALADKVSNLRDLVDKYALLGETMWESYKTGLEAQLWWNKEVLKVGKQRIPESPLVEQLELQINRYINVVMGKKACKLVAMDHSEEPQD